MTFDEWWDSYPDGSLEERLTPKELAMEAWKLGAIGARVECEQTADSIGMEMFFSAGAEVDPRDVSRLIRDAIYRRNFG